MYNVITIQSRVDRFLNFGHFFLVFSQYFLPTHGIIKFFSGFLHHYFLVTLFQIFSHINSNDLFKLMCVLYCFSYKYFIRDVTLYLFDNKFLLKWKNLSRFVLKHWIMSEKNMSEKFIKALLKHGASKKIVTLSSRWGWSKKRKKWKKNFFVLLTINLNKFSLLVGSYLLKKSKISD